jgi:polyisoprenoid-binding protein YceI
MNALRGAAVALAAVSAAPALAAPEEFNVDSTHTYPTFAVRHLGISTQRGRFDATTGKIILDRAAKQGSIDISIDTTSVSTGSPKIDNVLRGEDFFHVEKHPRMLFKSASLEFEGDVPKAAKGDLTLLGVTKPVTLVIDHFGCTRLPFFVRTTCGADVNVVISRAQFGMTAYAAFLSDDVRISVQVEAVKVEGAAELPHAGG